MKGRAATAASIVARHAQDGTRRRWSAHAEPRTGPRGHHWVRDPSGSERPAIQREVMWPSWKKMALLLHPSVDPLRPA